MAWHQADGNVQVWNVSQAAIVRNRGIDDIVASKRLHRLRQVRVQIRVGNRIWHGNTAANSARRWRTCDNASSGGATGTSVTDGLGLALDTVGLNLNCFFFVETARVRIMVGNGEFTNDQVRRRVTGLLLHPSGQLIQKGSEKVHRANGKSSAGAGVNLDKHSNIDSLCRSKGENDGKKEEGQIHHRVESPGMLCETSLYPNDSFQ